MAKDNKNETAKVVEKKTATPVNFENADMKAIMEQMALMQAKIISLEKEKNTSVVQPISNHQATIDREITFISLFPGILNLSTEGNGQGVVYTFESFGEIHKIPYSEAKMILKSHAHHAREGYFYIDDSELIQNSQLTKAYKTIIDQNTFESLFSLADMNKFAEVFDKIPSAQKEIFADLIALKLYAGEIIDMNIVMKVGSITQRDLVNEAKGDKEIFQGK